MNPNTETIIRAINYYCATNNDLWARGLIRVLARDLYQPEARRLLCDKARSFANSYLLSHEATLSIISEIRHQLIIVMCLYQRSESQEARAMYRQTVNMYFEEIQTLEAIDHENLSMQPYLEQDSQGMQTVNQKEKGGQE